MEECLLIPLICAVLLLIAGTGPIFGAVVLMMAVGIIVGLVACGAICGYSTFKRKGHRR